MAQAQESCHDMIQNSFVVVDQLDDAVEAQPCLTLRWGQAGLDEGGNAERSTSSNVADQASVRIGAFEFVSYKGDATKQEACEKKKMHLSLLCTSFCSQELFRSGVRALAAMDADTSPEDMAIHFRELHLPFQRSVPAMQSVTHGTADELYRLVLAEFQSTGVRTWEDKLNDQARGPQPAILRFYVFAFDNGPDNQGFVKKLKQRLVNQSSFLFWLIWCKLHQYHLIVASILAVIDSWDWSAAQWLMNADDPHFAAIADRHQFTHQALTMDIMGHTI